MWLWAGTNLKNIEIWRIVYLDEVLFYLEEIEKECAIFQFLKKIKVGRSEACDIQLCTNGVSRYHFQIEEGVLQDFDSLNGTYINSKRVKRCSLCMQDEIVFANIRMIYFKDYVLLDMVNNPYSNVELDRKNTTYYPYCLNIEMPKVQKILIFRCHKLCVQFKNKVLFLSAIGTELYDRKFWFCLLHFDWISSKTKNRITLHKYDQLFDNGIYFYGVWPLQPELSIQIKCKREQKKYRYV
ncbi:MAG: FHA domain-containing protein [Holdemanella porci]